VRKGILQEGSLPDLALVDDSHASSALRLVAPRVRLRRQSRLAQDVLHDSERGALGHQPRAEAPHEQQAVQQARDPVARPRK
jgi:hypothetical protein